MRTYSPRGSSSAFIAYLLSRRDEVCELQQRNVRPGNLQAPMAIIYSALVFGVVVTALNDPLSSDYVYQVSSTRRKEALNDSLSRIMCQG